MARHRRPDDVSNIKRPSTVAKAFVEACERLQYQRNPDFNGERIDGIGFAPSMSTMAGAVRPPLAISSPTSARAVSTG